MIRNPLHFRRSNPSQTDRSIRANRSFLSALFVAAACGIVTGLFFLAVLVAAGDFASVWQSAVSMPILFLPALMAAVCVFFFLLFRKNRIMSLLCCVLSFTLFGSYVYYVCQSPLPFLQLMTMRDQAVAKQMQQSSPIFENCVREGESQPALYFESTSSQQMPSKEDQEAILAMISELPDSLKGHAAGIYFLSEDTFNSCIEEETSFDAAGFSRSSNFSTAIKVPDLRLDDYWTVFRDGQQVLLSVPQSYKETIVHELTHLVDVQITGNHLRLSATPEWTAIYDSQKEIFGKYGASSRIEMFAEAGVYYYLYPDLLQQMSPQIYEFFETRTV